MDAIARCRLSQLCAEPFAVTERFTAFVCGSVCEVARSLERYTEKRGVFVRAFQILIHCSACVAVQVIRTDELLFTISRPA